MSLCVRGLFKTKLILVITLFALLMPSFVCSATYYDSSFPISTGLQSGYYVEFTSNLGNNCVVFFRGSDLENICITSTNNFYNCSSTAVNCTIFVNNVIRPARVYPRGMLQVGSFTNTGAVSSVYADVTDITILDTNIDWPAINPDSQLANNNLYFSKFEVAVLGLLVLLLFFNILDWWLLHHVGKSY